MSAEVELFDFIIVGAGTAGCVLANRLSAYPDLSILVIEAGENRNNDERVYTPGLSSKTVGNEDFDWCFVSEPQEGISGRVMKHPRGRVIGGSSAINSLALVYPSAAGMDAWADLGNPGWDWHGIKPYFRKFQTIVPPSEKIRTEPSLFHDQEAIGKTDGPIQASFPINLFEFEKAWVETFRNLGLDSRSEALDGHALGGHISTNHISGPGQSERSHAGIAYLEPVLGRTNLQVVTGAFVSKILFEHGNGGDAVANEVAYVEDGVSRKARVRREVVLAAGTFASPQILEVSGIGSPDVLRKSGIDTVVHANPNVGENLQDHIRPGLSFEAADGVPPRDPLPPEVARQLYQKDRSGPWAEKACYTFAYMPLVNFLSLESREALVQKFDEHLKKPGLSEFENKRNDFIREMTLSPSEATATAFLSRKCSIPLEDEREWLTFYAMLSHPFSRGSTHIQSADTAIKPVIDFGYYTHPLDLEIHALHLQALEKLAATPPLCHFIKSGGARVPEGYDASTIDRAKQVVKDFAITNYHPCGTCSMMPESMGGVVDSRLRVYGTVNVKVVDASIMPIVPRGNIITTVYAVAEKAADLILEDLARKGR